jgi:hypothetical protein
MEEQEQFVVGGNSDQYDDGKARQLENDKRALLDADFDTFLDPAVDEHSDFYMAMERDRNAAHLVAGTSFLDLNSMILKTECNNVYESMNESDMQKLRTLMWDVYVPHIKESLKDQIHPGRAMNDFHAQMYVVHLSVRVAQAMQLVFELNQKKSFSAVAKTAYEMALQDVLFHPHLKGRVNPIQYTQLINFLRRYPQYSTAFNTYVGYKLLRQQLVRGGGAGTNRKSNDAERLHDESANRLWSILQDSPYIYTEFMNASKHYKMEWHHLYYKEVANTLYHKLADSGLKRSDPIYSDLSGQARKESRQTFADGPLHTETVKVKELNLESRPVMDIVSAIQETRETVSLGPAKRKHMRSEFTTATITPAASNGARSSIDSTQTSSERPCVGSLDGNAAPVQPSSALVGDTSDALNSRMRAACAALFSRIL